MIENYNITKERLPFENERKDIAEVEIFP